MADVRLATTQLTDGLRLHYAEQGDDHGEPVARACRRPFVRQLRRAACGLTYPDRVASLALIGSGWTAANPVTREVQTAMRDLPDPMPRQFARDFQASTAYLPLPESFFERIVDESLKLPARLWRDVFDHLLSHDHAGHLARIASPTLLLWGEQDALFPREDQDRLARTIPGAPLTIYPETGHCPNWERPERVAADLVKFLSTRQTE